MGLRYLRLQTSWGRIEIAGASRAGDGTVVLLPQFRLALDAGRPVRRLPAMSTLFLSHGHMDHIGGLGFWAAQRFLNQLGPGSLIAPRALADDLNALLGTLGRLEGGHPYDVSIHGVEEGDHLLIKRNIELTFFGTDHWVPTLGCQLIWRRTRLRPELRDAPPDEIIRRRTAGEDITEEVVAPLVTYCGDTGPGLFSTHPEVFASELVLLEVSFFDTSDVERARRYGHMHLDDLLAHTNLLRCHDLVLLHASRRYRLAELEDRIAHDIAPKLPCRLHHLLIDWS